MHSPTCNVDLSVIDVLFLMYCRIKIYHTMTSLKELNTGSRISFGIIITEYQDIYFILYCNGAATPLYQRSNKL